MIEELFISPGTIQVLELGAVRVVGDDEES